MIRDVPKIKFIQFLLLSNLDISHIKMFKKAFFTVFTKEIALNRNSPGTFIYSYNA